VSANADLEKATKQRSERSSDGLGFLLPFRIGLRRGHCSARTDLQLLRKSLVMEDTRKRGFDDHRAKDRKSRVAKNLRVPKLLTRVGQFDEINLIFRIERTIAPEYRSFGNYTDNKIRRGN
jgi:hypothetical protein